MCEGWEEGVKTIADTNQKVFQFSGEEEGDGLLDQSINTEGDKKQLGYAQILKTESQDELTNLYGK